MVTWPFSESLSLEGTPVAAVVLAPGLAGGPVAVVMVAGGGVGGGGGGGLGGCLLSVFIDTDELLATLLGGCGCCLELFFVLPDFFLLCLLDFGLLSVVSGGVWNSVVTLCKYLACEFLRTTVYRVTYTNSSVSSSRHISN